MLRQRPNGVISCIKKIAALVLAAALLCSCTARVSVQRIPAELPPRRGAIRHADAGADTRLYRGAAALRQRCAADRPDRGGQCISQRCRPWLHLGRGGSRRRRAAHWDGRGLDQRAGSRLRRCAAAICDRSEDGSDAALTRSYLLQSAIRGGENSEESTAFLEEMDALCESLAADSRLAVYGARQIAFLFYLPISGTSFTMAHYADDGASFTMSTAACTRPTPTPMASRSPRPPLPTRSCTSSAHPIFTKAAATPMSMPPLTAYVEEAYPDDIMLSTYEADGTSRFDAISKTMSPLTAYCLGLAESCPELEQFPALGRWSRGCSGMVAQTAMNRQRMHGRER